MRSMLTAGLAGAVALAGAVPVLAEDGEAGLGKKGFYVRQGDFVLNTEFRLQVRFQSLDESFDAGGFWSDPAGGGFEDTDVGAGNDLRVRRARIAFFGTALFPWLEYKIQVDFGGGKTSAKDLYIRARSSRANQWTFGQFKARFDLFELISSKYQMFVERPVGSAAAGFSNVDPEALLEPDAEDLPFAGRLFELGGNAPGRDIGVMYAGHGESKRWNWAIAVQNGNGSNRSGNDDDDFLYTARLEFQNDGGFEYKATAADHPDELEYTVGLAWLSNTNGSLEDADGGACEIGASKACRFAGRDRAAWEVFGALRGSRFQINGTYQAWSLEDAAIGRGGRVTDLDFTAFDVDAGVFVTDRVEIAGRFGRQEPDDPFALVFPGEDEAFPDGATVVLRDARTEEWRLGVNTYFRGHHLKLMVDWGEQTLELEDRIATPVGGPAASAAFDHRGRLEQSSRGIRAMLAFFI